MNKIDHDRLFKELIETFFEEFLLLFFPQVYEAVDFREMKFLSEELFTDVIEGEKRRVDLLAETKLKGEDSLIIIHIEPQAYIQKNFNERMFIYFSRLYEKHRKKILPIALFSYDAIRNEPNQFLIEFPFWSVLEFQFLKVELKNKNWRDFLVNDNPVAAALLSKMGYNKEEKVEVKKEFLRMLVRLELDPARTQLIGGFFDTYLRLNEQEEQQLESELKRLNPEEEVKTMELTTSWQRKGRQEAKLEIARKMLQKGKSTEEIMDLTDLSESEIRKLMDNGPA